MRELDLVILEKTQILSMYINTCLGEKSKDDRFFSVSSEETDGQKFKCRKFHLNVRTNTLILH